MLTSSVLIVGVAPAEVESMLCGGIGPGLPAGAVCPGCGGALRGRWRGYRRTLRLGRRVCRLQIARARCTACRATHALLPGFVAPRRLDAAAGIYLALALAARGRGQRPIAERLGLPAATVRGWMRALRARAGALAGRLWALAGALGAPPARAPPGTGALVGLRGALGVLHAAARRRFGPAGQLGRAGLLALALAGTHTSCPRSAGAGRERVGLRPIGRGGPR